VPHFGLDQLARINSPVQRGNGGLAPLDLGSPDDGPIQSVDEKFSKAHAMAGAG
jgi:hypothetical protein